MAYGVKYRFQFVSDGGTVYRVDLSEDGYSGTVTTRPLGKAPVIRMQDSDCIRATSCDLVLECQSDGEFVDLYTTNPFQYKVEVQRVNGNAVTGIWRGYVATEIYSEPDIAPPYDVRITATDGIGILKEYNFEEAGAMSLREHICALLNKAGDDAPMFYYATMLSEYQGTPAAFMDAANIDLDYMVGKNCYEVLRTLLASLRSVIMYMGSYWLIVREVDVQMSSTGMLTAVQCIGTNPYYTPSSTTVKMGKSVGKMGVADIWPVGYLTRRVVPAKKSVKVRAEWNLTDGTPGIADWSSSGEATSGNPPRYLGNMGGQGYIYTLMPMGNFTMDVKVTVKVWRGSVWQNYNGAPWIGVTAMWQPAGGDVKRYHPDTGWTTESPAEYEEHTIERTNFTTDPALAQVVTVNIPGPSDSSAGNFVVYVVGHLAAVYDVDVELVTMKGYEDTITIDNGARGSASDLSITGGREIPSFLIYPAFAGGIWTNETTHGIMTSFSDLMNIGKDFMSITALAYAREVAAPRIEITGKLHHVYDTQNTAVGGPFPFIKSHGVWALLKTYSWDMGSEDVDFTALTLPSAVLSVDSEEITSIPNN